MDRRAFVRAGAAGLLAPRGLFAQPRPTPSAAQLRWQRDELAMFVHFGVNTFTDREWGDGRESPSVFDPARLDARQWARTARLAGFRTVILTAKHHDGFCLWPTATTTHSVASSPWRGGRGDVVRELVDACTAEGVRAGLYLSPWDRHHPTYGDTPRYNDVYEAQLTELLTRYGPLAEVWFDGANGEGPNGKRQVYDWPRVFQTVRRLQRDAVIFSDAGPDVRWCGNENGSAGDPNWSTVDPSVVTFPGADGPGVAAALQHGDARGTVWRPAECDVSIRKGWFHHASDDATVKSADALVALYLSSVGRNGKLLLNVPPTRDGVLHATDVARLSSFRSQLDALFAEELAPHGRRGGEIDLGRVRSLGTVRLAEDIARGQRVARFTLSGAGEDGAWRTLARGTTIGYARIVQITPTAVRRVRLTIDETVETPGPVDVRLFAPSR